MTDEAPIEFTSPGRFMVQKQPAPVNDAPRREPAPFTIGQTQTIQAEGRNDIHAHALALFQQARRDISIFSPDLETWLYGGTAMQQALSRFLLSSPRSRIRVLTGDAPRSAKQGHLLVKLSHRLPSYCRIRQIGQTEPRLHNRAFVLVDGCALLIRTDAGQLTAQACYSAPAQVRRNLSIFDQAWETAVTDPDLRSFLL